MMTTNFSAIRGQPGPTSPLNWMRDSLAALRPHESSQRKLMATLPMLGWDFQLPDGPGAPRAGILRRPSLSQVYSRALKTSWYPCHLPVPPAARVSGSQRSRQLSCARGGIIARGHSSC